MITTESGIRQPCPGVALYRNPVNGAMVAVFHYTADPQKRGRWADRESRMYPGGRQSTDWRQEFEIDFDADELKRTYWAYETERNVIKPFPIPTDWSWFLGIDWGQTAPTAVVFCAQNPSTQAVFVFDEIYVPNARPKAICAEIYAKLERHMGYPINGANIGEVLEDAVGDPSGPAFAQMYGEEPYPVPVRTKGFKTEWKLNDRRQGAARVNEAFSPSFVCCGLRQFPIGAHDIGRCKTCEKGRRAYPLLYILEGRAPHLERTLPGIVKAAAVREELEDPERDEKVEDHAPDALRYAIMRTSFGMPAHEQKKQELADTPNAMLKLEEILEKIRRRAADEHNYREEIGDDDEIVASRQLMDPEDFYPVEGGYGGY